MLPNQFEGKISDIDRSEAYFLFCGEQKLDSEQIASQNAWQKIGAKKRAHYRVLAGFQGM